MGGAKRLVQIGLITRYYCKMLIDPRARVENVIVPHGKTCGKEPKLCAAEIMHLGEKGGSNGTSVMLVSH